MKSSAFTVTYPGISRVLFTDLHISPPPVDHSDKAINEVVKFPTKAIWDTGATGSVITKKVVDALQLKPISKTLVKGVNSHVSRNVYLVHIYLPNRFIIPFVKVTECDSLTGDFEALVGMDIINLGELAVSNYNKQTTFSFRMPPSSKIDFVDHSKNVNAPSNSLSPQQKAQANKEAREKFLKTAGQKNKRKKR